MQPTSILFKTGFECGQNYGRLFHVEIAQRLDQAFLARKNFLWSFPHTLGLTMPHSRPVLNKRRRRHAKRRYRSERMQSASTRNETHRTQAGKAPACETQARKAQASKTLACETQAPRRTHARQPEDDNRNHPLASPARFPPFRQEYRAENKPRNSQCRKNAERHAEAVRIDAQIAARSERHNPDEHRRKQRA